jgi:hypothetical protein
MLKSLVLLFVIVFFSHGIQAQMQNDSITRKYLICKSTGFNFYSKIFVEGKRLLAVSNDGKKCRGHLKIINDTLFSLTNSWNFKCDTFNINQIRKLKNPNLLLTGWGIVAIPYGLWVAHDGYTMLGTGLIWDFLGKIFIIGGVSYSIVGPIVINGPKIELTFYNLKIHQAKGFKLKKKHLKYLYPNN